MLATPWFSRLLHAQVGAQDVAMGIKFSAACTLEIKEYPDGIPISMCSSRGDFSRHFPCPTSSSTSVSTSSVSSVSSYSSMDSLSSMDEAASSSGARDISFNLVAGDFQVRHQHRGQTQEGGFVLRVLLCPWFGLLIIVSSSGRRQQGEEGG
jgi:hypothetical protein